MQLHRGHYVGQEDPLGEAWQPTPVFFPGESHGQRSLAAIVHRLAEWDTNEVTLHSCTLICREITVTDNMRRHEIEI